MPTYDYRCKSCEHEWELFQSIKADAIKKCPSCGKMKAERVIGAGAGIIFKGSGFYETDYRSDSYKKAAEADKKAQQPPSESKPTSEKKSESKGESKGESKKSSSD